MPSVQAIGGGVSEVRSPGVDVNISPLSSQVLAAGSAEHGVVRCSEMNL